MTGEIFEGNITKHKTRNPLLKWIMKKFNKDVTDLAALCRPRKILDVGCGEGFTTIDIGKRLPQAKIIGIDIEKERIAYAKKKKKLKNITYRAEDLYNLPFKKCSFDLVVCNETLEHLKGYKKALRKVVEQSNKFVMISVPNEPWFRTGNMLRLRYLSAWGNTPGHVNHWTKKGLKRLVGQYGKIVRFKTSTFWNIVLIKKHKPRK